MGIETVIEEADASMWACPQQRGRKQWMVLHVRSRQEKVLCDDLAAMGVDHYMPWVRQIRYYGNRKARVEMPLFPGYVFLLGTLEEAYEADRTKRVAGIIQVRNQDQIDWELRNIHLALSNHAVLDPYPFLARGVRVQVHSGPFRGLQGVIEDRSKLDRLILQVQMLGSATSLEIDGALLEPLN